MRRWKITRKLCKIVANNISSPNPLLVSFQNEHDESPKWIGEPNAKLSSTLIFIVVTIVVIHLSSRNIAPKDDWTTNWLTGWLAGWQKWRRLSNMMIIVRWPTLTSKEMCACLNTRAILVTTCLPAPISSTYSNQNVVDKLTRCMNLWSSRGVEAGAHAKLVKCDLNPITLLNLSSINQSPTLYLSCLLFLTASGYFLKWMRDCCLIAF